jgi:L-alanine-DL-glutamate epimerase-like enolase superfamily enzyme
MQVTFHKITLTKRHPVAISRGVSKGSTNLFVFAEAGNHTGVGEMCPGSLTGAKTADAGQADLERLLAGGIEGRSVWEIWRLAREADVAPCALAALDEALWDLLAKRAGLPLRELLGLPRPTAPTSVTVGINPPDVVRDLAGEWLSETGAKSLKVKLGSAEGIEHDRAAYAAAAEAARPFGAAVRVDANGGWSLPDAKKMLGWLAERGAEFVEQPLAEGAERQLPELYADRALPIIVDESCRLADDVPPLMGAADGVNVKLMKCGGITEAVRIVATARACGLKTMIGCMGESSISIAAGASIGALFDYIDLDSHLNLAPDCAEGVDLIDGVVVADERPGHGGRLKADPS